MYVAPLNGQSVMDALVNVVAESLGPNASSEEVTSAVNSIRDDPNGIQIVAYSGGVQSFNTAVESGSMGNVTSQPLSAIDTVTYLSPGLGPFGPGSQLAFTNNPGTTTRIFHGSGLTDCGCDIFCPLARRLWDRSMCTGTPKGSLVSGTASNASGMLLRTG